MSDKDDDGLWSEIGSALTPRRSEAQWTALRARTMSRVKGSTRAQLRPWVAASALAALGFGLVFISRLTREPAEVETATVAWDTRLSAVEGLVTVVPAGQTDAVPAEAGVPVQAGDVIQVGADGRAELSFADKGVVSLGPNSVLKLALLDEPQSFLELSVGSLVAKLDWHADGKTHRLAVRTPAVVAAVRGTEFGVVVGADGATSVGVFDQGRVSVAANDEPSIQETMLTPNQELRVARGATPDTELRDGRYFLRSGELNELKAYRPILDVVRGREQVLRRDWRPMSSASREQERSRSFGGERRADSPGFGPATGPEEPRAEGSNARDGRPEAGAAGRGRGLDEERRGPGSDERRGPPGGRPAGSDERGPRDSAPRGGVAGRSGPRGPSAPRGKPRPSSGGRARRGGGQDSGGRR